MKKLVKLTALVGALSLVGISANAALTATGDITATVAVENVIESFNDIDLGQKTISQLTGGTTTASTGLKVYTNAATAPAGGLSVSGTFAKFQNGRPYLSIEAAGTTPTTPLYYAVTISTCNGGPSVALGGSANPTVTLSTNILSSDCAASAGTLGIEVEQYDASSEPPIVAGNYTGSIQLDVAAP